MTKETPDEAQPPVTIAAGKLSMRTAASIKPAPTNAKTHPPKQITQLRALIRRFGFTNPLLIRPDGEIIAGHGRFEAGKLEGMKKFPVVELAHLSDTEAEALRLADNRVAENGGWDEAKLGTALANLKQAAFDLDLDKLGFKPLELKKLVSFEASAGGAKASADDDAPDAADPSAPPTARRGDVFVLGGHRLMCGDTFSEADRARLFNARIEAGLHADAIVTDPPFAIYGSSSGLASDIADDKMIRPFFEQLFRIAFQTLPHFGCMYVCCDWRSWATLWEAAKASKISVKNMIVWYKGGSGLGSNYANAHELIMYAMRLPPETTMRGTNKERGIRAVNKPNFVQYNRPHGEERQHNAAKPVGLMSEFIEDTTERGAVVFEPFGGSGSTLIAAEKTGRRCFAMEIEPRMCDVIVRRWEKLTGKRAQLEEKEKTDA